METIQKDYAPMGVKFYYIYKALAHPELRGYVTPFTLRERLMHIQEAKKQLGSKIEWLCDPMSNNIKHALGNAQNSEFVIDPKGIVVKRRFWSNPEKLRKNLEELVGTVKNPTAVSDLSMELKLDRPMGKISIGVVPRIELPHGMVPLKILPSQKKQIVPFYAKLRAEVDRSFLTQRKGMLYLGFHLDPLYAVHWNNRIKPLEFELTCPHGVNVSPTQGVSPTVKESADKDPREFLLDITSKKNGEPLELIVRYFICDDGDTFCVPVIQRYTIYLEQDFDGGSVRRRSRLERGVFNFQRHLLKMDQNQDGQLTWDEVPSGFQRRFLQLDINSDNLLDEHELQAFNKQRKNRRQSAEGFVRLILRNDIDSDCKLSLEEAPERMRRRFKRMDTNQDSYVDVEELKAAFDRFQGQEKTLGGRLR